jgi:hypothetical protein
MSALVSRKSSGPVALSSAVARTWDASRWRVYSARRVSSSGSTDQLASSTFPFLATLVSGQLSSFAASFLDVEWGECVVFVLEIGIIFLKGVQRRTQRTEGTDTVPSFAIRLDDRGLH